MKKILGMIMCGTACWLLFAGSALAQGGQLMAAEYGDRDRRVDVTGRVREFMHNGVLRFEVTDQMLGVDPARNHVKEIFIRIRHWDGNVEEFRFPEHARVNLEVDPEAGYEFHDRRLHIMRAYYGGEGAFADVTERLRHMIDDGRLHTRADNEHMGVDPDPRVHKVLRVLYWFEGQRRNVVVPEHEVINLP
jgi:hypothetical protein